ncbi:hypothetical protein BP6252_12618 [Coleophoma cylindrospora]|uniref:AMP-activated protein kinase glycogen-binding domain-containing protein n=1 Tax=Coleophoma cylindrospora TaxID=1849047 RepID=A0A3D8QCR5_9HELO|nr:hypothetical protein BP6252_12618 [Coleophoma cylindrospora]
MASFKVKFAHPGTQPPVYVAGSFSQWQPQEMQYTTNENNEHEFYKEVKAEPGKEYQYKFRLGPGDWWVLDETAPTATDSDGNRNNLLSVPEPKLEAAKEESGKPETNGVLEGAPKHKDVEKLQVNGDPVSRDQSRTPDIANVASEVADSAAQLDRNQPTPPISDAEAGRIGLRRLSNTPIPEVANTAAEVADSAAIIDKNHTKLNMSDTEPQEGDEDSGSVTPWDERVPLFEHECMGNAGLQPQASYQAEPLERVTSATSNDEVLTDDDIDFNDPTLEQFPHDRRSILERVRTVETRLDEDETKFEGVPPSPVVGANRSPDSRLLASPSAALLASDEARSPSRSSFGEGTEPLEKLTRLPSAVSLRSSGVSELKRITEEDDSISNGGLESSLEVEESSDDVDQSEPIPDSTTPPEQTGNGTHKEPELSNGAKSSDAEKVKEVESGVAGPQILVHSATPSSSTPNLLNEASDKDSKSNDGKSTGIETEDGRSSQLTARKQPTPAERSITPNTIRSEHAKESGNILKAFWRVVFIDWIGGFLSRLCGSRRQT